MQAVTKKEGKCCWRAYRRTELYGKCRVTGVVARIGSHCVERGRERESERAREDREGEDFPCVRTLESKGFLRNVWSQKCSLLFHTWLSYCTLIRQPQTQSQIQFKQCRLFMCWYVKSMCIYYWLQNQMKTFAGEFEVKSNWHIITQTGSQTWGPNLALTWFSVRDVWLAFHLVILAPLEV
jgi:hypothetical protein